MFTLTAENPAMKTRLFDRFLKPSTRSFFNEGKGLSNYSFGGWLHGYVYSRWPYLYIGVGTGEHRLTRFFLSLWNIFSRVFNSGNGKPTASDGAGFADTYHGKVILLEEATRLVSVKKDINIGDLEQVIPYTRARDIVFKNPDHILALECPCRASRKDPCYPLDVCLIVGEPFASFIMEHQPRRSRWISQEEAMEILRAEHKRGHVHHAFFKDAMLGRFYAICNCCACCCGAMQAQRNGTPMLASSGYVSRVNRDLCISCGVCVKFCQFSALQMEDETLIVDEENCMGCGVCVTRCKKGAHSLVRDPKKGNPLEILELMERAVN
jgi:ferredoxin